MSILDQTDRRVGSGSETAAAWREHAATVPVLLLCD